MAVCLCVLFCSSVLFSPASTAVAQATDVNWPTWDNDTPQPHTVFGKPIYNNHDPNHNIVREYGAFAVYYDDLVLSPRWTAIKLTHYMTDKNSHIKRPKKFKTDTFLKNKGYKVTGHKDYNNPTGVRKWNRGHMIQFDDARGYGQQAAKDSFYTSNICPQLARHNQAGWLTLEKQCTEFARDYEVAWVYTGPIYGENKVPFAQGRKVPKPIAFYKIVVSPGDANNVDVLAFRMPHKPIPSDADLSDYLVSIDDIEELTGLDFLHELPGDIEDMVEEAVWEMWPDLAND
jgi:endonuclease G